MGRGPVKSESRQLASFHAVDVEGSVTVIWSRGDGSSAVVEAQENVLPHLKTEVVDGTLKVYFEGSVITAEGEKVTLTSPTLDRAGLDGSGDFSATGVAGSTMSAEVTGSGDMDLAGDVKTLSASVTGSGNLKSEQLKAEDVDASVTGSGNLDVYVSGQLNADVSGSGSVSYMGEPKKVIQHVEGSGSVEPK